MSFKSLVRSLFDMAYQLFAAPQLAVGHDVVQYLTKMGISDFLHSNKCYAGYPIVEKCFKINMSIDENVPYEFQTIFVPSLKFSTPGSIAETGVVSAGSAVPDPYKYQLPPGYYPMPKFVVDGRALLFCLMNQLPNLQRV